MNRSLRIAIDLMGSDSSVQQLFSSALKVSKELPSTYTLVLLMEEGVISDSILSQILASHPNVEVLYTQEFIGMEDDPLIAVRRKKNSSMAIGMRLLAEKKVDGFVSAGNTGALLTLALLSLPLLEGIERPALLAALPTATGNIAVLDVGANLSCKPQHLLQFAKLGAAYQHLHYQIKCPKIGLLNIGTESSKGTATHRRTYSLLKEYCQDRHDSAFFGNIEGSHVFQGSIDVLVTDGLSGNIFLKTSEGVSAFILQKLEKALTIKGSAREAIDDLHKTLSYAEYYGAILAGIDGLVIKIHGYSTESAFTNGIKGAFRLAKEQFIPRLKLYLQA